MKGRSAKSEVNVFRTQKKAGSGKNGHRMVRQVFRQLLKREINGLKGLKLERLFWKHCPLGNRADGKRAPDICNNGFEKIKIMLNMSIFIHLFVDQPFKEGSK